MSLSAATARAWPVRWTSCASMRVTSMSVAWMKKFWLCSWLRVFSIPIPPTRARARSMCSSSTEKGWDRPATVSAPSRPRRVKGTQRRGGHAAGRRSQRGEDAGGFAPQQQGAGGLGAEERLGPPHQRPQELVGVPGGGQLGARLVQRAQETVGFAELRQQAAVLPPELRPCQRRAHRALETIKIQGVLVDVLQDTLADALHGRLHDYI